MTTVESLCISKRIRIVRDERHWTQAATSERAALVLKRNLERNGPCSLEAVCPDPRNAVEDTRELPEVSQDEYGEEDHGPATAGGV
ncbi:WD repeat and FYVE domain-containing protein 3 [Grus japonensis]|uniref:WD repeat and FYVE domain-containing protein 3 n=1 Tax=Grus japonensis TaxID=30415 RepID=A0ABC9WUY3_GRUJA